MTRIHRIPWSAPAHPEAPALTSQHVIGCSLGEPWSQLVAISRELSESHDRPAVSHYEQRAGRFVDGPLEGSSFDEICRETGCDCLPFVLDSSRSLVADDPLAIAKACRPHTLLQTTTRPDRIVELREQLLDGFYELGAIDDQAVYETRHENLGNHLARIEAELSSKRFLEGDEPSLADVLLFTFSIRLDPVFYELYKATVGLLADFPSLQGHARDLYEQPAFRATTDFDQIKTHHYLVEPVLNARGVIPRGGLPDLDSPHFRHVDLDSANHDVGIEEDQHKPHASGEWVRPQSQERRWIRADGTGPYPAEAGRYHLYAPYNCPWSHRALLGRAVVGLEDTIGASVVYFRRDPDHGWQFNASIPGCTDDRAGGREYVRELYEEVGSDERSVPVLWDTKTRTIVSNESADILRIFGTEFHEFAELDLELFPMGARDEIERVNGAVYQRINNGAYKAGFADSQVAYERAFDRYFRALEWIDNLLVERTWLAGTEAPTEADLRLFPTIFRHDAIYYARFHLDDARIDAYPRLATWLECMLDVPGVEEASNLDHARNGYFGRTGNEIVPAGPVPLGLSPSDFSRDDWLNKT